MKKINITTQFFEKREIDIFELLLKGSSLCVAKLVPPFEIANHFFQSGKTRLSYREGIAWNSFVLPKNDYEYLAEELVFKYGLERNDEYKDCKDPVLWDSIQESMLTGKDVNYLYPLNFRIYWLRKLQDVFFEIEEGKMDSDLKQIHDLILEKMASAFKKD